MPIEKPKTKEMMRPPFLYIGEPGWKSKLQSFLESFGVPLPAPYSNNEVRARQGELDIVFPDSLAIFLADFGSVSFDYIEILPLSDMTRANEVPGSGTSGNLLTVASAGGNTGNYFALSREGACYFLSNHPSRAERRLKSFDDLIRIACIDLFTSYYGWDDKELIQMRVEVMREIFGFVL